MALIVSLIDQTAKVENMDFFPSMTETQTQFPPWLIQFKIDRNSNLSLSILCRYKS